MAQGDQSVSLAGARVLVVEDEYLIADELTEWLESKGARVVGPFADVDGSLTALRDRVADWAVLDLNLRGERTYPIADRLEALDIPFVFVTGYDSPAVRASHADFPRCQKPLVFKQLLSVFERQMRDHAARAEI